MAILSQLSKIIEYKTTVTEFTDAFQHHQTL